MAKVYAKTKTVENLEVIIDINSEYFLEDLTGWKLIDEGKGNKFTYAQQNYLEQGIKDTNGVYNYKLIEGTGAVLLTEEEKQIVINGGSSSGGGTTPVTPPTGDGETPYLDKFIVADGLETRIIINEIKNDKMETGYPVHFISIFDNGGKPTTINGFPFYKQNTTEAPVIKESQAYTAWFDADKKCFFVEASASGTATSEDVLAGKTFSSDVGYEIEGTMKDNGAVKKIMEYDEEYVIPKGYHNGEGKVLAPSKGDDTSDGTVTDANQILEGHKAYSKGEAFVGTMKDNGAVKKILDFDEEAEIPAGYHNGEGKMLAPSIADATISPADVLEQKVAYGPTGKVVGEMKNVGAVDKTLGFGEVYAVPAGKHNGEGRVTAPSISDANATADKVLAGVKAYGPTGLLTGNMVNRGKWGTTVNPGQAITVPAGYHDGTGVVRVSQNCWTGVCNPVYKHNDVLYYLDFRATGLSGTLANYSCICGYIFKGTDMRTFSIIRIAERENRYYCTYLSEDDEFHDYFCNHVKDTDNNLFAIYNYSGADADLINNFENGKIRWWAFK